MLKTLCVVLPCVIFLFIVQIFILCLHLLLSLLTWIKVTERRLFVFIESSYSAFLIPKARIIALFCVSAACIAHTIEGEDSRITTTLSTERLGAEMDVLLFNNRFCSSAASTFSLGP